MWTDMTVDLDLLSAALPHQMAVLGAKKQILYVNEAFRRRYGKEGNELLGTRYRDAVGPDLFSEYDPLIDGAFGGTPGSIQHSFPNRSQGRAWKTSFIPLPDGRCLVLSDDPGAIDPSVLRNRRTEARLQAFVDFAPIGMVFSHLDGRVLEANQAFLSLLGYSREELEQGQIHWDAITPPEYLHLDYEAIAEAKETGFSRTYEKEYVGKSGKRIHILIGFILVGPTREEAVAFVVDISAQKEAEDEVRRLNSELEGRVEQRTKEFEAANKELEAFCYSVSHDLRAPLRSIDGFAFALVQDYEDKLDSEGVDFLHRIRGAAKRMDELISALLALSRLTRSELDLERVNVSELAEIVAADLQRQNPMANVEISIQANLSARADRKMLQVLVDNLFSNAAKFSAKAAHPRIEFGRVEPNGPFFVRDNGVGFDMKDSSKLFQPFERLHSPREFSGNGIGLATVQRIVRKHGGTIWAEAEVDNGATFYFTL